MKNTLSTVFLLLLAFVVVSPAYGQVNLGTSASATNPERSGDATTGLFSSTTGAVSISSSGTEVMRVTGGSVGIGTTSPLSQLDVVTTSSPATRGIASYQYGASGLAALLTLYKAGGTPSSPTAVTSSGYGSGINMDAYDGSSFLDSAGVSSHINGTITTGSAPQDLILWTTGGANDGDPYANGHVRMTILSGGNIGIGTTAPTSLLHTVNSSAQTAAYVGIEHAVSATSSTASVNKTGVDIQSTGTWNGTGAVNIGLNVNATGGTTNYAALFNGGNVGVGTSSPANLLDVDQANTGGMTGARVLNNTTSSASFAIISVQTGSTNALFQLQQEDGTYPAAIFTAGSGDVNGMLFNAQATGAPVVFQSATSEVMRAVSGRVGILTASPSYPLHVNGTAYATGAAGALSDVRHKKKIEPLSFGLAEVEQLRPVTFEWKEPQKNDLGMKGQQIGFIAQEVEQILPSVVITEDNKEGTKDLKYTELIPVLAKAIQQLKSANDNQAKALEQLRRDFEVYRNAHH